VEGTSPDGLIILSIEERTGHDRDQQAAGGIHRTGDMGQPMAGHILNAGHPSPCSTGRARRPRTSRPVGRSSPRRRPRSRRVRTVVITMVTDTPDVEGGGGGPGGFSRDPPGLDRRRHEHHLAAHGARSRREAARPGGGARRRAGVGGDVERATPRSRSWRGWDREAFERVLPVLRLLGEDESPTADRSAAAQIAKLANPDLVSITLLAGRRGAGVRGARTASTRPPPRGGVGRGRPVVAIDKSRPAYYQAGLRTGFMIDLVAEGPPAGPGGLPRPALRCRATGLCTSCSARPGARFGARGDARGWRRFWSGCRDSSSLRIISIGHT